MKFFFILLLLSFSGTVWADYDDIQEFTNYYSRPNDDTFQNATGNAGEPYEVAKIACTLTFSRSSLEKRIFHLDVNWSAEMTTGRHVEAANFLEMTDEAEAVPLTIQYPKGVGVQSTAKEKTGSLLLATQRIGLINRDGTYSGKLQISKKPDTKNFSAGLQFVGGRGPKKGVFQIIEWDVTIRRGEILEADIRCRQMKDPPLRLVDSNYLTIPKGDHNHQHYPKQPTAAVCAKEEVGEGDLEEKTETESETALRRAISAVGCLDCHGEGNQELFRFCDSGMPLYPMGDASTIYNFVYHFEKVDWTRYPPGMKVAVKKLVEMEKENQVIADWTERNGGRALEGK